MKSLVTNEWFSGSIAGKNNSAYYIFGFVNEEYLFLDPHKIRKGMKEENYEISEFYKLSFEKFHPNVSFAFYIKNLESFEKFENFVIDLNDPVIGISEKFETDNYSVVELMSNKMTLNLSEMVKQDQKPSN